MTRHFAYVIPCPVHPEKVRKESIMEALDGIVERFAQPSSHIRRTYECHACMGWHYSSRASSVRSPRDPFPRPWWYGVMIDGNKVWQSRDPAEAKLWAKRNHGEVVPFMDSERRAKNAPSTKASKVSA